MTLKKMWILKMRRHWYDDHILDSFDILQIISDISDEFDIDDSGSLCKTGKFQQC